MAKCQNKSGILTSACLIFRVNFIVDFHQNGSAGLVLRVRLDHGTIEPAAAGLSTRATLPVQL